MNEKIIQIMLEALDKDESERMKVAHLVHLYRQHKRDVLVANNKLASVTRELIGK